MSKLSDDQQAAVIAALCEGVSIRSTERLTGIHRDTIMRLGLKVGEGCAALHGKLMRNLHVGRIEIDEVWSYVGKKRKNVKDGAPPDTVGDQYIFLAMDSTGKAILSWLIGKHSYSNTQHLMDDLQRRLTNIPEISTDGWHAYPRAVALAFDDKSPHGVVDKQTVILAKDGNKAGYYAKEQLVAVKRTAVAHAPRHISTSYIERVNLTLRMHQRRLTRLTNGFSKKFENHCAAIALWATHYNFCRGHETLRVTPAMHLGVTDHIWTVSELLQAALSGGAQAQVKKAKLRVIQGGKI